MDPRELNTLEPLVAEFDDAVACYDIDSAQYAIDRMKRQGYDTRDLELELAHVEDERQILEETGNLECAYDRARD